MSLSVAILVKYCDDIAEDIECDDMVSFGDDGGELSVWARLKSVILQPHALLAAVSVIAAVAQYADLCRWQEERDDLRLCLDEAHLGGGLMSEKCERIYGDVVMEDSQ